MKIAYVITAHNQPQQVCRLVRALQTTSTTGQIVIHHDRSKSEFDPALLAGMRDVHLLQNPIAVGWGEFSVVEAELRCLDWLMQEAIEFDWLVLLSGQDYPIRSLQQFEQLLASTSVDGFLEYFPIDQVPATQWNWHDQTGNDRYYYHYHNAPSLLRPLFYKLYRIVNWQPYLRVKAGRFGAKIALPAYRHPFREQFRCYAGSQWHTLSRRAVQYLTDFIQQNPQIVEHYRHTMIPDESFFQTILLNAPHLQFCNDNLRHISWTPPYPAIFGMQDLPSLEQSQKFFARKFDLNYDAQVLDQLDRTLGVTPLSV
jgi:Core-2/I-Branching enzyme